THGERNETLNKAAFSLGQLVEAGHLDEDEVVDRLYDAAVANILVEDDGPRAVMATIRSGLRGGSGHPRGIPKRKRTHHGSSAAEDAHETSSTADGLPAHASLDVGDEVRDPLEGLIERTAADSSAPLVPEVLERLVVLRRDDRAAFEALRARLK